MKRLISAIPAIMLIAGSQAQPVPKTPLTGQQKVTPPASVAGVFGVICPRESFNKIH